MELMSTEEVEAVAEERSELMAEVELMAQRPENQMDCDVVVCEKTEAEGETVVAPPSLFSGWELLDEL
jgi:hypothetical protein